MRVVFTAWAWPSHIQALMPLAWACRCAGHEVVFASEPAGVPEVARSGLTAVAVGEDVDTVGFVREYLNPSVGAPVSDRKPRALDMVLAHAESMMDDLTELVTGWRADLVVCDPTTVVGPLAAAVAGVPAIRHLFGTDLLARAAGVLPNVLAPLAARHGVGRFDPMGRVTLDPTPARLRIPADYQRLPIRWTSFNGGGAVPPGPAVRTDRPTICVTWGHTIAKLDPRRFLAGDIARSLGSADVDVVLAVSTAQAGLLGSLPDNTRVVYDAPLHHVLSSCDLVIAHGGAGTILTSLATGLPLLLVPQLPDHRAHSERLAAGGAGLVLRPEQAKPDAVCSAVARLLSDGRYRSSATALRQEIHCMPAPAAVVAELQPISATNSMRRNYG